MIGKYLTSRLKPVKFLWLAALFSIFVADAKSGAMPWLQNIVFLFLSFLVFRFIDDAGSVETDRKEHPERTYLEVEQYHRFLRLTITLTILYLLVLVLIDVRIFYTVLALIAGSAGLYFISRRSQFPLEFIPLLKYPVLLWCLSGFSTDIHSLGPITSTFFIIFTYDALEKISLEKINLFWGLIPLAVSGFLAFRVWENATNLWLILPAMLLIMLFKGSKKIRYVPVLYYPILVFMLNIN